LIFDDRNLSLRPAQDSLMSQAKKYQLKVQG